jgi:hypothetical protein
MKQAGFKFLVQDELVRFELSEAAGGALGVTSGSPANCRLPPFLTCSDLVEPARCRLPPSLLVLGSVARAEPVLNPFLSTLIF